MWCCGQGGMEGSGKEEALLGEHVAGFPPNQKIWKGETFTYLGSGIKYRKIAFLKFQLYEVALYVEQSAAQTELRRLQKKGFFKDFSTDSLCDGLLQGSFKKLLNIRLLRTVTFSQFTGEIGRDLQPRLDGSGDHDLWLKFTDYFKDKALRNGSNLLALVLEDRSLEGGLFAPEVSDFTDVSPGITFSSDHFQAAILDVYLGSGDCVPDARSQWAQSVQRLLS